MPKHRKFNEAEEASIRAMYAGGKTIVQLSKFCGASPGTIFRIVSPGARDRSNQYIREYRSSAAARSKWAAIAEQNAREAGL